MNCKNCGFALNEGDRFCQNCGTPVEHKKCEACGAAISGNATFCEACGANISNRQYDKTHVSNENIDKRDSENNTKLTVILIILIGLIIALGVSAIILLFTADFKKQDSVSIAAPTQAPAAVSTPAPTSVPAPSFNNISASSTRGADYTSGHAITYELQKAFDGSFETAWSCDRDYEITPTITLKANTPQYVSGVRIANGYFKSEATYQYNRRITKFEIDYDGGNTVYSCGIDQYRIMQDIKFEHPVCTSTLAIKVLETVDGKWHDVSISEIEIY